MPKLAHPGCPDSSPAYDQTKKRLPRNEINAFFVLFDWVAEEFTRAGLNIDQAAGLAINERRRQTEVEIDLLQWSIKHLAAVIAEKTERNRVSCQYPTSPLQERESLLTGA